MNTESFPQIGYFLGYSVDDMSDFIGNDKLDILNHEKMTLAAISSPMNNPSFILTGPVISYAWFLCLLSVEFGI